MSAREAYIAGRSGGSRPPTRQTRGSDPSETQRNTQEQNREQKAFDAGQQERQRAQTIKEDRVSMAPTSINSASDRFANAMPSSLSMQETGPINPSTMAKGSQLFSGPNEITFAAQGGIMNARKQIQRVA